MVHLVRRIALQRDHIDDGTIITVEEQHVGRPAGARRPQLRIDVGAGVQIELALGPRQRAL